MRFGFKPTTLEDKLYEAACARWYGFDEEAWRLLKKVAARVGYLHEQTKEKAS